MCIKCGCGKKKGQAGYGKGPATVIKGVYTQPVAGGKN